MWESRPASRWYYLAFFGFPCFVPVSEDYLRLRCSFDRMAYRGKR